MNSRPPSAAQAARRIGFGELEDRARELDRCVLASPEIDRFCSSSDWILPARRAFAPAAVPFVIASDDGFVTLMGVDIAAGGRALVPLEAGWGLACPIVGPRPEVLLEDLVAELEADDSWDALLLSGIPVGGHLLGLVRGRLRRRFPVGLGPRAGRCIASLEGGLEGFLARRSAKFRATLRREARLAARRGLEYEWVTELPDAFAVDRFLDRVVRIERRSWKGRSGQGIDRPPTLTFYELMVRRLAARGGLRAVFVTRAGHDVAYVFGGVIGRRYRGLQVSFDEAFREASPGKLAHLEMIRRLADEGIAEYDLGQDMGYKHRWAERLSESITVVALRSPVAGA